MRRTAWFVLACLLLLCGRADADRRRVLVLPLSGSVPGAPDGLPQLTEVVARAAGLTGEDVTIGRAPFADAAALVGCDEESVECFAALAESLRQDALVIGSVEPSADGSKVVVSLKVFRAGEIEEASFELAGESIDDIVEALARRLPRLFLGNTTEPAPPPEPEAEPTAGPEPLPLVPDPSGPRDAGPSGRGVGVAPWLVSGAGLALVGGGIGFLLVATSRQSEVNSAPIRDVDDFERLVEIEDRGARYMKIGNGLVIGGGLIAATGAALFVIRRMSGSGAYEETSVSVAPALIPDGAAVSVRVRLP
jgi:hypothetical protein